MKKRKKIVVSIIIIFILIICTVLIFGGNYLYNLGLNPKTSKALVFGKSDNFKEMVSVKKDNETIQVSDDDWLLNYSNYTDLYRTSKDGLKLHNYLLNNNNSHKWAITVHGYTMQGTKVAVYAKHFYDNGFNVIVPDLRGHGKSEGNYIGMGWDDRLDIIDLINYIVEKDPNAEIALYGISMGAATVMNTSGEPLPNNVKTVVEDCGYTSVMDEFSSKINSLFHIPSFPILNVAEVIAKFRAGYWLNDASPIKQIAKSKTPTLFIHGDADTFVPYSMMDKLYNAANVEKEKFVMHGAKHAKSVDIDSELYFKTVDNFVNKYIH